MDGGIIGVIVIVFVVIGLFSAAAQGSKKKQQQSGAPQPPRPAMSDIQRAFMMMTGIEEEKEQPSKPQVQSYTPATPAAAYSGVQNEGSSDYGTARPGSLSDYVPYSGTGSSSLSDYTPPRSGSLDYTPLSREELGVYTFAAESVTEAAQSITELQESEGAVYGADLSASGAGTKHHKAPTLKLFHDQSDYVRAVIYSEILSRRQRGRRV